MPIEEIHEHPPCDLLTLAPEVRARHMLPTTPPTDCRLKYQLRVVSLWCVLKCCLLYSCCPPSLPSQVLVCAQPAKQHRCGVLWLRALAKKDISTLSRQQDSPEKRPLAKSQQAPNTKPLTYVIGLDA
eukprot:4432349-Amphidinium_carterae.1